MFNEIILFFKENANGILYLMFFFVVILTILSHMTASANYNVAESYSKNFFFSLSLISILIFIFSLLGYNFTLFSSSSALSSSYSFFKENGLIILNVVIMFISLITLFSIVGIDFNQPKTKTIKKVVEIESFSCDSTNPITQQQECMNLSGTNCVTTQCCGWLNDESCVASDGNGKNINYYSDTNNNPIEIDSWCTINGCVYGLKKEIDDIMDNPIIQNIEKVLNKIDL
jgi:hypothetical protein